MRESLRNLFVLALVALFAAVPVSLADELDDRKQASVEELEQIRSEISLSQARRDALAKEIEELEKSRATINRELIDTSTRQRKIEQRITKAGNRLSQLRDDQAQINTFLVDKRDVLAEVLGALQRMGRKPPPALIVSPNDALSSVRSAMLLGAVVPEIRSETEILLGRLSELTEVTKKIESQRSSLSTDFASLAQEEERLNLLLDQKRLESGQARDKLATESAKTAELAAKATSLNSLIEDLEREIETVRQAAEAARLAELRLKEEQEERINSARAFVPDEIFSDPGRISPAISFESAKGLLPLPVAGVQVKKYGELDGGEPVTGISLETRENSRVISPVDAWVLFARPFRSYGQLLILNAGNGYHIVIAGMEEINVQPGQFVLLGEPVGRMGAQEVASTGLIDLSTTKPILYVEFRKDGESIDPAPWWAGEREESTTDGS